jgi:hypothetical protein
MCIKLIVIVQIQLANAIHPVSVLLHHHKFQPLVFTTLKFIFSKSKTCLDNEVSEQSSLMSENLIKFFCALPSGII